MPAKYVKAIASMTTGQQETMFTKIVLGMSSWEFVFTMYAIPGDSTIPW